MNPLIIFGATFQSDSAGWKIQTAGRRLGEWVESQFYRFQNLDLPIPQGFTVWPEWLMSLQVVVFWTIVTALVVWAAWMLYVILHPYARDLRSRRDRLQGNTIASNQVKRTPQQWLHHAQTLQKQKRYAEACRALYLGMVQSLQDKNLAPQRESATDGEFRQLVQTIPKANACDVLIETHEQTVFGNVAASEQTAQQCQTAYQEMLDL
ncbi:MAG: DUF4129 domain-containing protein [Elainellaceae cyanobacterium]